MLRFFGTFFHFWGYQDCKYNQRWQRKGLGSMLYPWYYMSKRNKGPINALCTSHPYAAFPFYFLNQFCPFWLQPNIYAFSSNVRFCIIWILFRYTSETYIPGEATLPEQMQQNYLTCKGQNGWWILIFPTSRVLPWWAICSWGILITRYINNAHLGYNTLG